MGINKKLGLPYGEGMEKVAVCFDVDGTLIDENEQPIYPTIAFLRSMTEHKWKNVDFIIWSGGGAAYAQKMTERHVGNDLKGVKYYSKFDASTVRKLYQKIIAIDDIQDTRMGDVNMIVRSK